MRLSTPEKNMTSNATLNGWGYWLYLGLFCGILFVRDVFEVNVPLVVLLLYFAFGYLTLDYDHSLALTAILPIINHGVQTNYIAIMAVIAYLVKYSANLKLNVVHGIVAAMMVLELLHIGVKPFSFAEYVRYLAQYMYFALIIGESRIKSLLKDPIVVLRSFVFVVVYFMLDVILVTTRYVDIQDILTGQFRFGILRDFITDKASLYDNENMVGMYAIIAINLTVICMIKTRKHILRDAIVIMYLVYFGFLTQSKTFLICLLISAVLYGAYLLYSNRRSINKMVVAILVVSVLLFLAVNVVFKDAMTAVMERFEAEDLGTGRGGLWLDYNQVIMSSAWTFMFGIGLQEPEMKTGIWNSPHNGLQEVFVCWGLVGFILAAFLIIALLKRPRRYARGKVSWWYFVPFLIYFAIIQTMQWIRMSSVFNIMIPLFIAAYMGGLPDEQKSLSDYS